MKIVLLGFMGSGKTTIGKILAQKLSLTFMDLDQFIELKEKKSINEIFSTSGEKAFRTLEKKALRLILEQDNVVIAVGGGTPCFFNNMELIGNKAISLYIKASEKRLFNRLSSKKLRKSRPLLRHLSSGEIKKFIHDRLQIREKYYQMADHIVVPGEKTALKIALEIIHKISAV